MNLTQFHKNLSPLYLFTEMQRNIFGSKESINVINAAQRWMRNYNRFNTVPSFILPDKFFLH